MKKLSNECEDYVKDVEIGWRERAMAFCSFSPKTTPSKTRKLLVNGSVDNISGKSLKGNGKGGGPGWTRTSDQWIMSPLL